MDAQSLDLSRRSGFDVWSKIAVRYRDLDLMGHVNHAVIVSYFEQARSAILDVLPLPEDDGMVLGEIQVRYLAEIGRGDTVVIGTAVTRIGERSFTLGQGAFIGDSCVATCLGTLVYVSRAHRRSVVMPPAFRELLETY